MYSGMILNNTAPNSPAGTRNFYKASSSVSAQWPAGTTAYVGATRTDPPYGVGLLDIPDTDLNIWAVAP
jgi:hypothetical protein